MIVIKPILVRVCGEFAGKVSFARGLECASQPFTVCNVAHDHAERLAVVAVEHLSEHCARIVKRHATARTHRPTPGCASVQPETRARVNAARDAGDRFVFKAKRLGACSTDQAARDAVERAHRGGTGIHTTR